MILSNIQKKTKYCLVLQGLFFLFAQGLFIYLMELIAELTDVVVGGNANNFFQRLPVVLFFMFIQIICYYLGEYMKTKVVTDYAYQMRNMIYEKIVYAKNRSKEESMTSHILNFYNTKLEILQTYVGSLAEVCVNPIIALLAIVYIARINVKLLLVSCILIPFSSYLYNRCSKPLQKKTKEIFDEKESLNRISKDILDGFYMVKAYRLQKLFFHKFQNCSERLKESEQEKDKMNATLGRVFILLRYIPQLIIPLYGGYLSYCGELSIGQLIEVNTIIWYVLLPIEAFLTFLKSSIEIKPITKEINGYFSIEQEIDEESKGELEEKREGQEKQGGKGLALEINDLSFSYDQKTKVLHNLSFSMKRSEHVAIIGKSGAGKSTLIKILCGLERNYLGQVKIDGISMKKEKESKVWRQKISYVPQNPYLFEGTILENIEMGKHCSMEEVVRVAKLMDAHDFICQFPEQYDTKIGNGGLQLSGGQRKKIALARAILHDGTLFILDEPMSAFDAESTRKVKEGLSIATKGKALIMISHVPDDYENFDRIVKMEGGRIYE